MSILDRIPIDLPRALGLRSKWLRPTATLVTLLLILPTAARAQSGSPFDTGFMALQTLLTGTIAKAAGLIAIVIGGYQFAHGEPAGKERY